MIQYVQTHTVGPSLDKQLPKPFIVQGIWSQQVSETSEHGRRENRCGSAGAVRMSFTHRHFSPFPRAIFGTPSWPKNFADPDLRNACIETMAFSICDGTDATRIWKCRAG